MKKSVWIAASFMALVACAEKNIQSSNNSAPTVGKIPFFMSKPQPTNPVQVQFENKYEARKPVNYRKNETLRMSGSATFSPTTLKELAKPVKKLKAAFYIFDLRQESHGYINDRPVTWHADHEWSNADLSHDEVVQRERRLLLDTPLGSQVADVSVESVETEESVVVSHGYEYVRLTVTEHLRPTDTEVDRFLQAVKSLPEKSWVHFHCLSGEGRTTLFMMMYDMLHNAKTESLEDIVKRNAAEDLLQDSTNEPWKAVYQKERADFIKEFYNYAKAHPNGDGLLWTEWVRS